MFETIFSSFWTWIGTVVMFFVFGYALSLPFYWWARAVQEPKTSPNRPQAWYERN